MDIPPPPQSDFVVKSFACMCVEGGARARAGIRLRAGGVSTGRVAVQQCLNFMQYIILLAFDYRMCIYSGINLSTAYPQLINRTLSSLLCASRDSDRELIFQFDAHFIPHLNTIAELHARRVPRASRVCAAIANCDRKIARARRSWRARIAS